MKKLVRYDNYSRKEIHDIFSPDTTFTPGSGYWGISGIIKVPNMFHDYIFLVTYGQKQTEYEFDENIDENGILTWQSQPSQTLKTPQIQDLINHNHKTDNIYLFLRTNKKSNYTFLGLLGYVTHDNEREKPVHFKWQILNWSASEVKQAITDLKIEKSRTSTATRNYHPTHFQLNLKNSHEFYASPSSSRSGKKTKDFYSNKNINFEEELQKNSSLGEKGEALVVDYEKEALISLGRPDLAEKVTTTRKIAGNAERFDVLSYDEFENKKYIEVKTTTGSFHHPFHLSENEIAFSHQYGNNYYLYRVYHYNMESNSGDLKIVKGPIDRNALTPTNYTCKLEAGNEI